MTSYWSVHELSRLGLGFVGKNVRISRHAHFYSSATIVIGDDSRIDDFCILSGRVRLGRHVHLAAYSAVFAAVDVVLEDYSGLSAHVVVYSSSDHYYSDTLMNPTVPDSCRNVLSGPVTLGRFVTVGAGSVILPGVRLGEGCTVGALSLVNRDLESWWLYAGNPARKIIERPHERVLAMAKELDSAAESDR